MQRPQDVALQSAQGAVADGGRALVLYIEDDDNNVRLVKHILARAGRFEVVSATEGRLAVELARAHRPALILLDLNLPDMAGADVTAALQSDAMTRDIPIVILSGATRASERRRVLEAGAKGFLAKPFAIRELIDLVERFSRDGRPGPQPSPA